MRKRVRVWKQHKAKASDASKVNAKPTPTSYVQTCRAVPAGWLSGTHCMCGATNEVWRWCRAAVLYSVAYELQRMEERLLLLLTQRS